MYVMYYVCHVSHVIMYYVCHVSHVIMYYVCHISHVITVHLATFSRHPSSPAAYLAGQDQGR